MRRIHQLSPVLANQIAAGEVVERPASVVKELVENSLDADACRVEVEIESGGAASIVVRDDGDGIHPDDVPAALERHATSKLETFEQLVRIASMGFRGEALPSIASVSRLKVVTRTADSEHGVAMGVHGGCVMLSPEPAAHPVGTTIEVRELFYNTPARRKFLRTARTEARHCELVMRRLALSRPDVRFTFSSGERTVFDVRANSDPHARLAKLCGPPFADAAIHASAEIEGLRAQGWLASPQCSRHSPDLQHVFVNGRSVADGVIRHAVRLAFGDRLPPGQHPAYVLALTIDPTLVDVNVHPTKHEVRFREPRTVHDFVRRFARDAIETGAGPIEESSTTSRIDGPGLPAPQLVRDQLAAYGVVAGSRDAANESAVGAGRFNFEAEIGSRFSLCRLGGELVVLDVEAAARYLAGRRLATGERLVGRPLLIPVSRTATEAQVQLIEAGEATLARFGIAFRIIGPERVSLRQVPLLIAAAEPESVADRIVSLASRPDALDERALGDAVLELASVGTGAREMVFREPAETIPQYHETMAIWRPLDADAARRMLRGD